MYILSDIAYSTCLRCILQTTITIISK